MTINKIETLIVPDTPKLLLKQEIRVFAPVDEFTKVTSGGILLKRFDADTKLDKLLGPAANMTYLYSSRYTQDGDIKHDLVEVYSDYAKPLSIVQRTSTGNIVTVSATEDNHAVSFGQYYAGITNLQNNKASFEDLVTLSSNLNTVVTEFKEDVNNRLDEQEQKLDLELVEVKDYLDTELSETKSEVNTTVTNVTESLKQNVDDNTFNINVLKRVLLETGDIVPIVVEDAYISRETAAGKKIFDEQYTDVLEIKGSTVSCKNLIPYPYTFLGIDEGGVKGTFSEDKMLIINGESNSYIEKTFSTFNLSIGTYAISTIQTNANTRVYLRKNGDIYRSISKTDEPFVFTVDNENDLYTVACVILSGNTFSNDVVAAMLNEGETPLPYQPYFTGLKHAYIDSIKSTGRNFVPPPPYNYPEGTYAGITYKVNSDGSVTANGKATSTSFFVLALGVYLPEGDYTISDGVNIGFAAHMRWGNENYNMSFHSSGEARDIEIRVEAGTVLNNVTFKPMINRGYTALPYEPYTEDIYQLPQTLELPEFDRVNPQTGEITRGTGKQSYNASSVVSATDKRNSVWYYLIGKPFGSTVYTAYMNEFVPSKFTVREVVNSWDDAAMIGAISASGDSVHFYVGFPPDTTMEEAQAAIDGLEIEYKLATPTTETIANVPKGYKVHNHGSETVNQGTTDNSKFGAMPTITNEYIALLEVTDE